MQSQMLDLLRLSAEMPHYSWSHRLGYYKKQERRYPVGDPFNPFTGTRTDTGS
jgi:hypothetical protein